MADDQKVNALQKSMGEPVGFDVSEAAAKIKRNLILISSVVLVLIFWRHRGGTWCINFRRLSYRCYFNKIDDWAFNSSFVFPLPLFVVLL
ncbi:hypothetical protein [Pseudomonas yamanorum]|uniref:hypothetical protein n=1 Tax=Pseudomonas yamanorum TaxID=515393 RepID=UPI003B9EFB1A